MRRHLPLLAATLIAAGCGPGFQQLDSSLPANPAVAGDANFVRPIAGLTPAQIQQFNRGRVLFDKTYTPQDGLGPLFNNTSCKACHGFPNSGGGSAELLTLIAGDVAGAARTLKERGGPVISDKSVLGVPPELFPQETKAISKRISPITYGVGLLEAIPASAITAQLDYDAAKAELGIKGKANYDVDKIGRFGWKLQTADMRSFTVTAANFEMGLTSAERPYEFFPNVLPQQLAGPALYASASYPFVKAFFDARGAASGSPDMTKQDVDDMTAFQRFQAPPPQLPLTAQPTRGKTLFSWVGCAHCHVPEFKTGKNDVGIPAGVAVQAFTDLLLHDLGPAMGDGILWQGTAKDTEWRTTPLWGLRYRKRFIHDGRTDSLEEAIQLHGGESAKVTDRYNSMPKTDRDALKAYLMTI